jgi:hypothetical protein
MVNHIYHLNMDGLLYGMVNQNTKVGTHRRQNDYRKN